ncbi:hypothetical protein LOTGIDRAFT_168604 [Lottia gigantea]|uniref:SOCS box domain-containing protein n=1 Tax=Lottia gigantea TaxID=225164 RepID=V4B7G3_LOTGI|nr:hypothetical protein LOTGIDRAFT_168604 [Lottia gigantea]ESO84534.1 hypothetical protein LOTGIDRAFT_168604 [Lottia gigantea]
MDVSFWKKFRRRFSRSKNNQELKKFITKVDLEKNELKNITLKSDIKIRKPTNQKDLLARPTYYGIEWKLKQVFTHHIQDLNEQKRLLQYCQQKFAGVFNRLESSGESLMHNLITALPDDRFESYKYCNTKIVEVLIEDSCDTAKLNRFGDPPVIAAYKMKKLSVVAGFLNKRVDCNVTDKYGASLVILTCKENDVDTLRKIVCAYRYSDPKLNLDLLDVTRNCAISYATLNNNMDVCRVLLEAGANPNAGFTSPLYQAVKNDCSDELIALLIQHKASVNVWADSSGLNTLMAASYKNRTEVVRLLLEAGAHFPSTWHKNKSFVAAIKFDNLQIVLEFVTRSVDITSKSSKGTNVLHESSIFGSTRCLEYLINDSNMDLVAKDRYGKTPFYLAAENGHVECLQLLFNASADSFEADQRGRTPLDIAVLNDHQACVQFMFDNLVCSRRQLVNVCLCLKVDYDQSEFRKQETIDLLQKFVKSFQEDSVGPLMDMCVLEIRKILGQRNGRKIFQLPLPTIIKNLLLN